MEEGFYRIYLSKQIEIVFQNLLGKVHINSLTFIVRNDLYSLGCL